MGSSCVIIFSLALPRRAPKIPRRHPDCPQDIRQMSPSAPNGASAVPKTSPRRPQAHQKVSKLLPKLSRTSAGASQEPPEGYKPLTKLCTLPPSSAHLRRWSKGGKSRSKVPGQKSRVNKKQTQAKTSEINRWHRTIHCPIHDKTPPTASLVSCPLCAGLRSGLGGMPEALTIYFFSLSEQHVQQMTTYSDVALSIHKKNRFDKRC